VIATVSIDDAHPEGSTGLIRGHLALSYDPSQFAVSAADVYLGSLLAGGGWSLTPNIDPTTGHIAIAFSSSTPIASVLGGSLVTIDFHPLVVGRASSPSITVVAAANVSGQVIATELEDAQGTFTLSPAPAGGVDARIDRGVTLSSQPAVPASGPGSAEAVPAHLATSSANQASAPEAFSGETPAVLVTAAPPASAEEASVDPAPAAHAPAAAAHALMVAATPLSASVPGAASLASVVAQVVSTAASNVPSVLSPGVGPRVTDQFFQSLARVTALGDVTPVLLSPVPQDNGGGQSEDDVTASWNAALGPLGGLLSRTRRASAPAETTSRQSPAEQAALDQYFAVTVEESAMDLSDQ
jgi:hypothetical protein